MSHPPKEFPGYVALMSYILETELSSVRDANVEQVWRDPVIEEYNSILKNYVWGIIPKPIGKSTIDSKWFYKIKHVADGSIEKCKARFVARGFSQKKESTTLRLLLQLPSKPLLEPLYL